MPSPLRLVILLALAALTVALFQQAHQASAQADVDPSRVVLLFGGVVLVGGATGVLFVIMVLPAIGDAVGNFFFQPNQAVEKDPHSTAQAAVARGDYEGAAEAYLQILEKEPADTLAYSEFAKISCEHLGNPIAAADLLEEALQREWMPEDAVFLSSRLVDVYWKYQHDAEKARALLLQIIEAVPGTRHAANAEHRLKEIDGHPKLEG